MSYTFLLERGEESSAECFSDIEPFVRLKLNLTAEKCSCNGSGMGSCPGFRSGTTCEISTADRGVDLSTSCAADSRVKHSAQRRGGEPRRIICGRKCCELSAKYHPSIFSPKTLAKMQSYRLKPTLPNVVIPRGELKCQQPTWAQTILGLDGGYLPTPTTKANWSAKSMQKWPTSKNAVLVFGVPTPENHEWLMGWPIGHTDLKPLEMDRFRLWLHSHGEF